ncbi:MAG: hypothetical protein NVSMB64_15640 [Candidatus Velthaea sp.]
MLLPPHALAATDAGMTAPFAKVVLLTVSDPIVEEKPGARTATVGVLAGEGDGKADVTVLPLLHAASVAAAANASATRRREVFMRG